MHILHEIKWFGLSLALHLAVVVCGLIAMTPPNVEITPKAIMVVLDNLDTPSQYQPKAPRTPLRAEVRPVDPFRGTGPTVAKPGVVMPEPVQPSLQPDILRNSVIKKPPEQSSTKEVLKVSQQHVIVVSSRPVPVSTLPPSLQQTMPAEEGHPAENAQQKYVKEQFNYIRDLITKQLVYPPMARKMNWSGRVVVAFIIDEDGSVHAIRVTESSGFPLLDKSAMATVRNVAPFPRPPVRAEIVVPVNFRMMQ